MVRESNQNALLIPIGASSFLGFEISEFEISRVDCTCMIILFAATAGGRVSTWTLAGVCTVGRSRTTTRTHASFTSTRGPWFLLTRRRRDSLPDSPCTYATAPTVSVITCNKYVHWLLVLFWPIRFDVTIVSSGNNCNVKPDWPGSPLGIIGLRYESSNRKTL